MKTKFLLTAFILLISLHFTYAQYLVSATFMASKNAGLVQTVLNNWGWDTSQMELNGVKSYKIIYNTVDVNGQPTLASGALYVPQYVCDTLPIVSYQHGTEFEKIWVPSNNKYQGQGLIYSGNGYITTLPDYLGLGENPGFHPYVHWESEATASIDLIRAAREFLTDSLQIWDNNQLFLAGYSQGGHSTMAVHKYITINNLQNEFNVVASAPMSGAFPLYDAQFPGMFDGDSTYYRAEFLPYTFASYQLVYGNLYENYNEFYDPPFDSIIADWLASGIHWAGDWSALIPDNFYDFMQDSVLDNIQNDPNHPVNIDLRDNDLHNWIPQEPVRMLYCGMDSMVFPQNSLMAHDTMIAYGAIDVQALDIDPNGIHETCFIPTTTYALDWFNSLNAGCQIVVSIPSVNILPEISLFPNPVEDLAAFSSAMITSYEIYDITGILLFRSENNLVNISGLKTGLYIVIGYDKQNYPLYKGKIVKN